jgi:glycosyltransferase involved in cell wall biosynthesis
MKLLAILRIKDQIDTIDECLTKLTEIVDEIVVLDNGSTDGTLEAYKKYPKVVTVLETVGFDEGRDKCMLLDEAKKRSPDWIVWTDADEVFEEHFTRAVVEKYMSSRHNRFVFRMCNFWLDRIHCRYDGSYFLYTLHPQRSMWRNLPSAYFINKKIHNGDILGVPGKPILSPYRLKHYGYADPVKMKEKHDRYKAIDPNGRSYAHLDPTQPFRSFVFREYDSAFLNICYIWLYKWVCNVFWLVERIRIRLHKFFMR